MVMMMAIETATGLEWARDQAAFEPLSDAADAGASRFFDFFATSPGKIVNARCLDCDLLKKGYYWTPGTECPACGGHRFFPEPESRYGELYEDAYRSDGPSRADEVFAQVALWAGLATRQDLAKCFRKQRRLAAVNRIAPGIDEVLAMCGVLTAEQAAALFDVLNFQQLRAGVFCDQERDFLDAAVRHGWITETESEELLTAHQRSALRNKVSLPIGCFAIHREALGETQVRDIYDEQRALARGLLHEVDDALKSRGAERKPRTPSALPARIGLVLVAFLGLYLSW